MTQKKEINLNHICKIEGHASLSLKIEKNKVKECELKASEGARFFEALVLGKKVEDVQEIVSRICGICSSAHSVCSVQALEEALEIIPSEEQKIIRELLMIGERIRSHITHLYFLSLPDYYGFSSALEMSKKYPNIVKHAIELISIGNKIVENSGGREIHPFLHLNQEISKENKKDFSEVIKHLEDSKPKIKQTIELFKSLKFPKLERETNYLCLSKGEKGYSTITGKIKSSDGLFLDDDYKKHLKENIKEYATSKFALSSGKPLQVGAMARINNNSDYLDNETKKLIKEIELPLTSPFENNLAQSIELLHLTNRAIELFKKLEKTKHETPKLKIRDGRGISAVEAPRGTLFHEYKISKEGIIEYCNIITPTVQNLNMMELDIKTLVDNLLVKNTDKEKIVLEIEKLIRAYDPCFSCSTHFLKVNWL